MADESIRIPIEIDGSKGLAQLVRFSRQASKEIGTIGPSGSQRGGEIRIPITVDPSGGVSGLRILDAAANNTANNLRKIQPGANQAAFALQNLGRVAQDAPFGFMGIANNINPLVESFQRLKTVTGSTSGALKSMASGLMGAGGLGLIVSLVSTGLILFGDKLFSSGKAAKKAGEDVQKYKDAVKGIFENAGKEAAETSGLVAILKSETETRERKLAALKELKQIQPEIFGQLKLEGGAVIGLDNAYKNYIDSLRTVIAVKIKQAQLDILITKQLESQGATLTASEKKWKDYTAGLRKTLSEVKPGADRNLFGETLRKQDEAIKKEGATLQSDIEALIKDITELSKGVKIRIPDSNKDTDTAFDNIISKAKEVAAFLKDSFFVINYEFSPLDSKEESLRKAKAFLNDVATGNLKMKIPVTISTDEPARQTEFKEKLDVFMEGIQKGIIVKPVDLNVPVNLSLNLQANAADESLNRLKKLYNDIGQKMPAINMEQTPGFNYNVLIEGLRNYLGIRKNMTEAELAQEVALYKTMVDQINATIQQLAIDEIAQVGEAFGAALAGDDMKDALKGFVTILASAFSSLGKQMIVGSKLVQALKASLKGALSGPGMLIAGVGLVALGAALRASVNKGVTGLAEGGLISGSLFANIGEGRGTGKHNPEVVSPLDKLKGFFAGMLNDFSSRVANVGGNVGYGGLSLAVPREVMLRMDGRDMVGLMTLVQQTQNRGG